MNDKDHDRGIRNEEAWHANDSWKIAHEETQRQSWIAHANVHQLEDDALQLQHGEYIRRLEDLNHEATRIAADKATFLPREVYEAEQREVTRRSELLANAVTEAATKFVSRESHETYATANDIRVNTLERSTVSTDAYRGQDARLKALEDWKNKATGAAVVLTLLAGGVGAAVVKLLGG